MSQNFDNFQNYREKYSEMSTNMPSIGLEMKLPFKYQFNKNVEQILHGKTKVFCWEKYSLKTQFHLTQLQTWVRMLRLNFML